MDQLPLWFSLYLLQSSTFWHVLCSVSKTLLATSPIFSMMSSRFLGKIRRYHHISTLLVSWLLKLSTVTVLSLYPIGDVLFNTTLVLPFFFKTISGPSTFSIESSSGYQKYSYTVLHHSFIPAWLGGTYEPLCQFSHIAPSHCPTVSSLVIVLGLILLRSVKHPNPVWIYSFSRLFHQFSGSSVASLKCKT